MSHSEDKTLDTREDSENRRPTLVSHPQQQQQCHSDVINDSIDKTNHPRRTEDSTTTSPSNTPTAELSITPPPTDTADATDTTVFEITDIPQVPHDVIDPFESQSIAEIIDNIAVHPDQSKYRYLLVL